MDTLTIELVDQVASLLSSNTIDQYVRLLRYRTSIQKSEVVEVHPLRLSNALEGRDCIHCACPEWVWHTIVYELYLPRWITPKGNNADLTLK